MLSKNQIKFISSLKQKKFREEQGLFIAEGNKLVLELLQSEINVKQLFTVNGLPSAIKLPASIEHFEIKSNEMERISSLTTPTGILAVCEVPQYQLNVDELKNKLTLILDDIKDPGNLGTIIRIADWFGIPNIICSNDSADVFNPKVIQATMGSIARVKVFYTDLAELLKVQSLKSKIFGALLEGENIYAKKLPIEGLIIIGNESKGISENLLAFVTDKISIPSYSGKAESLNAAVATAIICSEFRRSATH